MAIVLGRKGGGSGGGGGGSVNEITSTDNSVTITDPSGPTVDLSVSGGSQPSESVTLTAADLSAAANGDFAQLVEAPPSKCVIFLGAVWFYEFGTVGYGEDASFVIGWALDLPDTSPGVTNYATIDLDFEGSESGQASPGSDHDPADSFEDYGLWGKALIGGPIVASTLAAGGIDYEVGDIGTIQPNVAGDPAEYEVLTVDGGGAVLTYSITAPGTGFLWNPEADPRDGSAVTGVGSGFAINVTEIALDGDGTLSLTVFYGLADLPS